jgi:uncharacterized protein (DUF1015 family)
MAEILPFKAWRYNEFLTEKLLRLSAPLSETIFQQKEAALYQEPYHNFHIASPSDAPPFENISRRVKNWKLDGVIRQDNLPAIYVYYQYFGNKSGKSVSCRKGFVCMIRTSNFEDQVVLPHEMTVPAAVKFRTGLLQHTDMHTTPTHGLYTDDEELLEHYLDESIAHPIYEITDVEQTRHVVSIIQDQHVIDKFIQILGDKKVFLADGHHRYESSLNYKNTLKNNNPYHQGTEPYNYHMMWLTNTVSSDLGIQPTHRLVHRLPEGMSEAQLLQKLEQYFEVAVQENIKKALGTAPTDNLWKFALISKDKSYILTLKPEALNDFDLDIPEVVKRLDVSIMHYFIFDRIMGFPWSNQFEYLSFSQDYKECIRKVQEGEEQLAVLTRKVTFEEIKNVCESGNTMPAKATYFFPKVLGGLVFGSVKPDEF